MVIASSSGAIRAAFLMRGENLDVPQMSSFSYLRTIYLFLSSRPTALRFDLPTS